MNKKMILSIVILAIIAFVSFGLFKANGLKIIQIEKKVRIQSSKQKVFDLVKYMGNFPKWSPFLAEDPSQTYQVKGADGTVGAQYHWLGNKGKDVGFQEIKKINEGSFIGLQCDIQKPFVATPSFDYYFSETAEGIEVKQVFKVESSLGNAFFMWLFGARAGMEKMNQKGLDLLKIAAEKHEN